jgi:hypothetical protein
MNYLNPDENLLTQSLGMSNPTLMTRRSESARSFLELPAEMRNQIYELLFSRDEPIRLRASRLDTALRYSMVHAVPGISILSSCRQVHAEATAILYSQNAFQIWPYASPKEEYEPATLTAEWLHNIGTCGTSLERLDINMHERTVSNRSWATISIGPILRHIWSVRHLKLQVTFVERPDDPAADISLGKVPARVHAARLNGILDQLRTRADED